MEAAKSSPSMIREKKDAALSQYNPKTKARNMY
jgi:hypothetical protein